MWILEHHITQPSQLNIEMITFKQLYTTAVNVIVSDLRFGGLGGNNGRQSWFKDDVLVSLSTPWAHISHVASCTKSN